MLADSFSEYSLLDDFGRVAFLNGEVFRIIAEQSREHCESLLHSELFSELQRREYIPKTEKDFEQSKKGILVLKHERIYDSKPYEWSFSMYKAACLHVLNVNHLCNQHGYELKDAHLGNILFKGKKAIWIDIGSIQKKKSTENHWIALNELIDVAIIPLIIWSEGDYFLARKLIESNYPFTRTLPLLDIRSSKYLSKAYQKLPTHLFTSNSRIFNWNWSFKQSIPSIERLTHLYSSLRFRLRLPLPWLRYQTTTSQEAIFEFIEGLHNSKYQTAWMDYTKRIELPEGANTRFDRIVELILALPGVNSIIDLAGNQGYLSQRIRELRPDLSLVNCDYDQNAIDSGFLGQTKHSESIQYILANFMFPVDSLGWKRHQATVVLLLAATHHLVLSQKIHISAVFEQCLKYSSRYVAIEFMPLGLWCEGGSISVPEWYTLTWFSKEFETYFEILHQEQLEPNRTLFIGELKKA